MKLSLRTRLLAVALLGVFTCAVAVLGLGRILQITIQSRMERARDAVAAELAEMRRAAPASDRIPTALRASTLGMRGGYLEPHGVDSLPAEIDGHLRAGVEAAIHTASTDRDTTLRDGEGTDPLVVYGAAPTPEGPIAWVVYTVKPPTLLAMWRIILVTLTVATVLLVGTAVSSVVSVRRGADALNASLAALAGDLASPVPRPPVPELADLADHIAGLAGALARAQTDKERLGAELAQRDRLAALGRVAAGVAHEVRNPLASIKLRVDLGRLRPDTPRQLAGELASVSDEITRLDRLVADLLVVAGRRTCSRTSTRLGELISQRVGLLSPWARERGVRIEVTGAATCALDADAVARAVDNLVRNAVEASPAEGAVEVEVADDDRGGARVRVRDRGAGVDDARTPELFEPFFTTKPDGTGLGLALSRAIAAAHGGTLTYARQDGVTCFELTLPRASSLAMGPRSAGPTKSEASA